MSLAECGSLGATTVLKSGESFCAAFQRWVADPGQHDNHHALATYERLRHSLKANLLASSRLRARFSSHSDGDNSGEARTAAVPRQLNANDSDKNVAANDYSLLQGRDADAVDAGAPTRAELDAQVCIQRCVDDGVIDRVVSTHHLQVAQHAGFRTVREAQEKARIRSSASELAMQHQPRLAFEASLASSIPTSFARWKSSAATSSPALMRSHDKRRPLRHWCCTSMVKRARAKHV